MIRVPFHVQLDNICILNRNTYVIIYTTINHDLKTKVYYFLYKFLEFFYIDGSVHVETISEK